MQRHERQHRAYAHAVCAGVCISAAVHAVALGSVRFGSPAPAGDGVAHAPAPEPRARAMQTVAEPVMQVIALREVPAPDPAPLPTAGPSAAAPRAAVPSQAAGADATVAPAPGPALAVAEVVGVPAAALPRVEPDARPGGESVAGGAPAPGEPAAAAAQPAAPEPEAATAEEEYELPAGVPLYEPGSIGRAKGRWGGEPDRGREDWEARRRGVVVIGGGRDGRHCPPLPGRIPPRHRPPAHYRLPGGS